MGKLFKTTYRKPKPKSVLHQAFSEVKNEIRPRKQKIAIALSKARAAGARIPKPRGK